MLRLILGVRFVDTAEIYGSGYSERLLGQFLKDMDQPVLVATKFFPWPWRLTKASIPRALRASLERLGLPSVDLYQIHWASPLMSPERMMEGMVECVKSGLDADGGCLQLWADSHAEGVFHPCPAWNSAGIEPGAF